MMNGAESVRVCGYVNDSTAPVPASVPGEFWVPLDECMTPCRMDEGAAGLLLTWIEWVEIEVQGFPNLVERMRRLRGAVMAAGATLVERRVRGVGG